MVWLFLFIFVYCDFANRLMPAFEAIFTGTNMLILFVLSLVASAYGIWKMMHSRKFDKIAHMH